jgi:hypothetical protein
LLESQNVLPLDNESKALIMKLLKFHFSLNIFNFKSRLFRIVNLLAFN